MKNAVKNYLNIIYPLLSLGIFILAWYVAARIIDVEIILPTPARSLSRLGESLSQRTFGRRYQYLNKSFDKLLHILRTGDCVFGPFSAFQTRILSFVAACDYHKSRTHNERDTLKLDMVLLCDNTYVYCVFDYLSHALCQLLFGGFEHRQRPYRDVKSI